MDDVLAAAVEEHKPSSVFALFSGGHDSLAATAIAAKHPSFTAAVHINTLTGISWTLKFVRDTCRRQGWPLLELKPDAKRYEDLIREQGFGWGPKAHSTAYYWLKQRQLRRLVRESKTHHYDRIMFVTGIRAAESVRRMEAAMSVPARRVKSVVWVNPILDWSAVERERFIQREGLPHNPVVETLHRSGECLCGTMLQKGERDEILFWYPEMKPRVDRWELIAAAAGHVNCVWGSTARPQPPDQGVLFDAMPLCQSCSVGEFEFRLRAEIARKHLHGSEDEQE